jgi:hypothetical protein
MIVLSAPTRHVDIRASVRPGDGTFTSCHASSFPGLQPRGARTYADEKDAFRALRLMLQSRYPGEYVAVANGEVYGHDPSRWKLAQRFFGERRQGPVYIGFVGQQQVIRVPTPFIRRH